MTDYNDDTPLNLAMKRSTSPWFSRDEKKMYTEVVDYLKPLPTEHSELLLDHTKVEVAV